MIQSPESYQKNIISWLICFSASLFFFFDFLQMSLLNSISSSLLKSYSINTSQLGYFSSIYIIALVVMYLPAGLLLDHFSTRKLMLSALAIAIGGTFLFAFAPNLLIASIGRILVGLSHPFAFLGTLRLISRWLSSHIALAIALLSTIGLLAGITAQYPIAFLTQQLGWRHVILLNGFLGVFIWFIMWSSVQDYHDNKIQYNFNLIKKFKDILLLPQNWLCAFYAAILNLPIFVLGALWGDMYLEHHIHLAPLQAANVNMIMYLGMMVGAPFCGWFSDFISRRKMLMIGLAVLGFLSLLFITWTTIDSIILFSTLFFLLGFSSSGQVLSYTVITESNHFSLTGTAVGLVSIIDMGLSGLFQPLFGNIINHPSHHVDKYYVAMMLILAAFIINVIIVFFIRETFAKKTP